MRRYALRDDQWERIRDLLPGREGHVGVTAKNNRLFVEAVLYRYRAGIPWRDLPERFGDPIKTHTRFSRWAESEVWKKVLGSGCRCGQCRGPKKDGQDQAIGRSKGGLSTKIHAMVDALGLSLIHI